MNIENIDDIVYNYIFDLNEIKRCWYLYIQSMSLIEHCSEISKADQNRIKQYHKDFKEECYKIIKRIDTDTTEHYENRTDTLILINLHIQKILNQNKYRKIKELKKAMDNYSRVNNMLGAESAFSMFINNNYTAINLAFLIMYFIGLFIFAYILKDLIGCIVVFAFAIVTYFWLLFLKSNVRASFKFDKINRTVCNYTYKKSQKSQVANNLIHSIILKFIDKI